MPLLSTAASPADLMAARSQMAVSLGWHIIIACLGVGFPLLVVFAEWRGHRTGDPVWELLAHRWARALGVLFAVGAVSGTILSFELGILWPGMMGTYGQVIGLPFAIEGIWFFTEAIFLGIYLYAWDRLPPRLHMLSAIPICISGVGGAFFVVAANAWMNQPRGFDLVNGKVTNIDPWAAMFNPAVWPQATHMILAAYLVTGYGLASVYAVAMLKGRRDRYHRLGFLVPFAFAAALTPVQFVVGDWAAHFVADKQPVKLAAMEGVFHTGRGVPLHLGGVAIDGEMRYAIEIPFGLSLLAHWDPNAEIVGLDRVPPDRHPPVNVVHLAFQTMVGAASVLLLLAAWFGLTWWRRRQLPRSRWFLRGGAVSGALAVLAMEAGWVTTEVGRQPWIVYGYLRTKDAVSSAPGLRAGLYGLLVVYTIMTIATVYVLRRLAREPLPLAPQEQDVPTSTTRVP